MPTTFAMPETAGLLLDVVAPMEGDPEAAGRAAVTLAHALQELPGQVVLHFVTQSGQDVAVPVRAARMLMSILEELAQGHTVALTSREEEVSTREAAELLGVSRPHVVKLIDVGVIPHRMAGTHRRVLLQDVLEYKRSQDERHSILDALADEAQAFGLYNR
jgi:excisionase family DNA binding protein